MIDIQEAVMEAVPVQKGAAVEVHELRKEFRRKDSRSAARSAASAARALDGVSFTMAKGETVAIWAQTARGSRRWSVCSRRSSCRTAGMRASSGTTSWPSIGRSAGS